MYRGTDLTHPQIVPSFGGRISWRTIHNVAASYNFCSIPRRYWHDAVLCGAVIAVGVPRWGEDSHCVSDTGLGRSPVCLSLVSYGESRQVSTWATAVWFRRPFGSNSNSGSLVRHHFVCTRFQFKTTVCYIRTDRHIMPCSVSLY